MSEKSTAVQTAPAGTSLRVVEPQTLFDRINRLHDRIARRAFEIFEGDGGFFGRELDHWFKAERELLHPVHLNIRETDDELRVEAEVPGFEAKDLEVSIEPRRLTISGKKETTKERGEKGKVVYEEQRSSELLRMVDLPAEVDAARATATLKNGVLELALPKSSAAKSTRVGVKAA